MSERTVARGINIGAGGPSQVERPRLPTPEVLLGDNWSLEARYARAVYLHARSEGRLNLVFGCSDSRVKGMVGSADSGVVSSIGSAPLSIFFKGMFEDPRIHEIEYTTHYSSASLGSSETVVPKGCGGISLAAAQRAGNRTAQDSGPDHYVGQYMSGAHVLEQGLRGAQDIASVASGKSVWALAIDHDTGVITPFGVWTHGGRSVNLAFHPDMLNDPELLYRGGLPSLDGAELNLLLRDRLDGINRSNELNRSRLAALLAREGTTIPERNRVIDPVFVSVRSTPIAESIHLFPDQMGKPNSVFGIHLPKFGADGTRGTCDAGLDLVFNQLDYPINGSLAANNQGDPFYSTQGIVLTAEDEGQVEAFLERARQSEAIGRWLERPANRITVFRESPDDPGTLNPRNWQQYGADFRLVAGKQGH